MAVREDNHFPEDLLQCAPRDRLAYFKAYTVRHTRLERAFTELIQAISEPANAAYILLVGPTGVGKTTLRLGIERHLIAAVSAALDGHAGRLPVCSTTAVGPDSGTFNWKDYYRRALQALQEPLIGDKVAIGEHEAPQRGGARLAVASSAESPVLRRALEHALQYRRPQAFIVDEAQHFLKVASGRRLQDQMDSIKSLADYGETVHVLLGTYDLLALQTLNGQVIRRGITLHFPRYRAERPEDVVAFQRVLVSFEQQLPVRVKPDLLALWPYCFERSLGCVGVLKDWLTRALATALAEDATTVTPAHLRRHALAAAGCERMLSEALHGEEQLAEQEEAVVRLRFRLGLPAPEDSAPHSQRDTRTEPKTAGAGTRRPGERLPKRDPIRVEGRHGQ
jgi:hypothetical protein